MDFMIQEERVYREARCRLSANASPAVAEQDLSAVADAGWAAAGGWVVARKWAAATQRDHRERICSGGEAFSIKQVIYEQKRQSSMRRAHADI